MAGSVPPSVVSLLTDMVGADVMAQGQIAELQTENAQLKAQVSEQGETIVSLSGLVEKLANAVADLQGHAETVTGDAGLTTQIGDLSQVPVLQEKLTAALPVPAEAVPSAGTSADTSTGTSPASAEPAATAEPQPVAA